MAHLGQLGRDANLTPFNARSMPEQIGQSILASDGLPDVTPCSVTQPRHQIGIALGAKRRRARPGDEGRRGPNHGAGKRPGAAQFR